MAWIRCVVRHAERDVRISSSCRRVLQHHIKARRPLARLQALKLDTSPRVIHLRRAPSNPWHPLIATSRGKGVRRVDPKQREPVIKFNVEPFRLDATI